MVRRRVPIVALVIALGLPSAQASDALGECDEHDAACSVALFQQQLDLRVQGEQPDGYSEETLKKIESHRTDRVHNIAENITNLTNELADAQARAASVDATKATIEEQALAREQRANRSAKLNSTYDGSIASIKARRDELENASSNLDDEIATLRERLQLAESTILSIRMAQNFVPSMEDANKSMDAAKMHKDRARALAIGGAKASERRRLDLDEEVGKLNSLHEQLKAVQQELYGS
eukprot:TRINITY_DN29242_c0_g1_i1.p1 TRINITY_DN29242_c0_g1~~TRINITY_DN29242_c0_g1_i1.p1  ORF type:complete len:237 (+),score=64.33 TRINITY_DN29242_c0_g1_i1:75-785(+)